MGRFMKGDVVVLPFPFSDLTSSKKRPAIVVAPLNGHDILVCQVTSRAVRDDFAVPITRNDLTIGHLHQESNVRPNRLFTADSAIVLYRAARLTSRKMAEITAKIIEIITS